MAPATLFTGKTLEDAVKKGLDALGIGRAEAMITVIEEGSGGFLGLGARPYRVRIMPRPGGPIREPDDRESRRAPRRDRAEAGRERGGRGGRERTARGASGGESAEPAKRSGGRGPRSGRPAERERAPVAGPTDREARRGGPRGDERRDPERQSERRDPEQPLERGGEGRRPFERRDGDRRRAESAPRMNGGRSEGRAEERGSAPPRREDARREEMPRRDDLPRREDTRRAPTGGVPAMSSAPGVPGAEDGDEPRRRRRRGRRGGRGRGGNRAEMPAAFEPAGDGEPMRPVREHEPTMGRGMDAAFATPPLSAARIEPAPYEAPLEMREPLAHEAEPAGAASARFESEPMEPIHDEPAPMAPYAAGADHGHDAPRRESGDRGDRRPFRDRDSRRRDESQRRPETPALSSDALAAEGIRCTQELLRAMGFEGKVSATASEDRVDVVAEVGSDDEMLNGAKGEVRQALQHLLNRMVNRGEGSRYHLQLEINDFWKRREEELQELARQLADRAVANQTESLTEYLNAQERRIIHVALREDTRVKTYALGDGMIKRLAVAPADFPEGPRAE